MKAAAATVQGWLRRYRSAGLLLAALGFGALAMYGARGYIAGQLAIERERLQPRRDELEVVVAKRELRRGDPVSPDTMAVRRIPREFVPGTAVLPDRFDGYVGARLNASLRGGEPLLHTSMDGVDAASFSAKVRQGIRALTIGVDEVNSMSGMMQPGDRIDLHFSARPPLRPGAPPPTELTVPLLQDVLVLATGRQVRPGLDDGPGGRGYTSITVEVTPAQAQRLIVAQRSGRLTALLRNRDDRLPVPQQPLDVNALLDLPVPRAAAGRSGPEIIIGGRGPLQVAASAPPLGLAGHFLAGPLGGLAAAAQNAPAPAAIGVAPGAAGVGQFSAQGVQSAPAPSGAAIPPRQAVSASPANPVERR